MHVLTRRLIAPALLLAAPVAAQTVDIDTIPGRFDFGKMWTYEYAPSAYFSETYGFDADAAWFDRVRLSVLRVPGCSASFVSPNGLVATNHHCVRGRIVAVQREGESLLDDGFYAASLEEERSIPGYYADRLIAVEDVSEEVLAAIDLSSTDEGRREARGRAVAGIETRLGRQYGDVHVEVRALYHGGRYSAYVFRRFTDVRLVAAAELQVGFFGGDPDNFTYPRYALDFAFLRVYDEDGRPFRSEQHLGWSREGVSEGSVVFVVGNPGPTSRLLTMAQLELSRDVITPYTVRALADRLSAMRASYAADPGAGEAMNLRNIMFSLSNSLKAYGGRLDALLTPGIMTRKRLAEEAFLDSIRADPALRDRYGDLVDRIRNLQGAKRALGPRYGAFRLLGSPTASSALLRRALGYVEVRQLEARGLEDQARALRRQVAGMEDLPERLEHALLAIRLADFVRYLGKESGVAQLALQDRTPERAAAALLEASVLADRASTGAALEGEDLDRDIAVRVARAIQPIYTEFQDQWQRLEQEEAELAAELGRARFEVYGTSVPPDATSSPRITDGLVLPYSYNGTVAPVYTTFFGLYDHYHSYGDGSEWDLPERWLPVPPGLDLATPLNFISTADTYGGNSGSPAITPGLEMVGLNFDRNIEGLSRDFIYLPERGRNVMVDVRAITEALDDVYDADRIVEELISGRLIPREGDANEAIRP